MNKLIGVRLASILATLVLSVALAGAQAADRPRHESRLTKSIPASASKTATPHLGPLESVLGREVRTRIEQDGGRVIDLLVDRNGRVQAAVIEFGGFLGIGTRKIAVEWAALHFEGDGNERVVTVHVTRDQLRVTPEYKPSEPTILRRAAD